MEIKIPKNRYNSEAQKTDLQKSALFAMRRAAELKEQQIGWK
jgi:hypothetical protein